MWLLIWALSRGELGRVKKRPGPPCESFPNWF